MTTTTSNQGLTIQTNADPANEPGAQVSLLAGAENRLAQRYTSVADRTARNPAPNEGEISHLADVDRYEVFDTANWVSLDRRGVYFFGMLAADAAPINNSVTPVSDATMTATLTASATFAIDGTIFYDCSTAADFKVDIVWPGSASGRIGFTGLDLAATTSTAPMKQNVSTVSASTFAFGGVGVGSTVFVKFDGRITTVGTGNLVVQYAQNNLDATNLVVRSGSFLRVVRIQ